MPFPLLKSLHAAINLLWLRIYRELVVNNSSQKSMEKGKIFHPTKKTAYTKGKKVNTRRTLLQTSQGHILSGQEFHSVGELRWLAPQHHLA